MNLEELIDQQINLGHKDPHTYYDLLIRALGDDLVEIARPHLADFITDMGRQRLNAKRRASIAKITPKSLTSAETMLHSLWVPTAGSITYKRIADMTAEDFDARAEYLERMVKGITRHAQWCRQVADDIRAANTPTAAGLTALPTLPDD